MLSIRKEVPDDIPAIYKLVSVAFGQEGEAN